jgi:hypothetical protein
VIAWLLLTLITALALVVFSLGYPPHPPDPKPPKPPPRSIAL